eukprot:1083566-Karenia_brevis.AAC.1
MLMLMSLRARFSDLVDCLKFEVRGERATVTVREMKTSRRSKARLPVTLHGPTRWVTGGEWMKIFLKRREEMNIPFPEFPLFPARIKGEWVKKQGRLQDYNSALKMVLATVSNKSGVVATSHGLKATTLEWSCAYGLKEDERAALGYHIGKAKDVTVWVYA